MGGGARCMRARRAQAEIPGGKFFFADVSGGRRKKKKAL